MTDRNQRIIEIPYEDIEAITAPEAWSLLFGVSVEEIRAHEGRISGEWTKAGRRRIREAQAALGGGDMIAILEYWAAKDYAAEIRLIYVGSTPAHQRTGKSKFSLSSKLV